MKKKNFKWNKGGRGGEEEGGGEGWGYKERLSII